MELDEKGIYEAPESLRFQIGALGADVAPCGVWQNAQICDSLLALAVRVTSEGATVAEKLCLVLEISEMPAAPASPETRSRATTNAVTKLAN